MATHRGDNEDDFVPLPPKLPHESRSKYPEEDQYDYVVEEREPQRYIKVKVARNQHVHDQGAHPRVEPISPTRRPKRDSGKYLTDHNREERPSSRRVEHDRHCNDSEVRRLTADFNHLLAQETRRRVEAERAVNILEDRVNIVEDTASRLREDLAHERHKRSSEARDREDRLERERLRRLDQEAELIAETRRPVIVHNHSPIAGGREASRSALDRAQDDYRRRVQVERPVRDQRRPGTSEGVRPRRQSVVIVDDTPNRRGDRSRH
ncbi:hypothetical protein B0A52_01811 [Exophiala mesophila]|uniref:Uncharacterized protein n=1 Tax=Exophiala mesophila TaxID=212818 RepID=A0A438NG37_EXOME|nr:hypothetical protein B0A52_01811 [Exophiala mesophila]